LKTNSSPKSRPKLTDKLDPTLSKNNGFTLGAGYSEELRHAVYNADDKYKLSARHEGGVSKLPSHRHVAKNKY
jgi:hypothetical protein